MLQRASRRQESLRIWILSRLFEDRIDPWDDFRDEVKKHVDEITVPHRPRKKSQGSLHNDTAYGLVDYHEGKASQVVHRVSVTSLTKTSLT